jgi:hypothetical protein
MSDLDRVDELPPSEQEVRTLIARVAARGAAQANGMTAQQVRDDAERYQADEVSLNDGTKSPNGKDSRGRSFWIAASVAVAVVVVAALIALPQGYGPSSSSPQAPSRWRLASSVRPATAQPFRSLSGIVSPSSITCPTLTVCYVIGEVSDRTNSNISESLAYVSRDGGSMWHRMNVPMPAGESLDTHFTCPSATTCMVGAESTPLGVVTPLLLTTRDAGMHWSKHQVPVGVLSQVTCFSSSVCYAFGTDRDGARPVFLRTDDGGARWRSRGLPLEARDGQAPSLTGESAFSCPTEMTCVGLVTVRLGHSQPLFRSLATLAWRTSNGGNGWSSSWVPGQAIQPSCWDAQHCIANDSSLASMLPSGRKSTDVVESSDGGASWKLRQIGGSKIDVIQVLTCLSHGECVAAGFSLATGAVVVETHDGGVTWSDDQIPPGTSNFMDLDCPSSRGCFAIAYDSKLGHPPGVPEVLTDGMSKSS